MALYNRGFQSLEALSLHKQRPAIFGPLWFLAGLENNVSLFSQKKITDLVPDLVHNLRCLRHKARINLGIT